HGGTPGDLAHLPRWAGVGARVVEVEDGDDAGIVAAFPRLGDVVEDRRALPDPVSRPREDAAIANDERPAALEDLWMGQRFEHDLRADPRRIAHRNREEWSL